MSKQIDLSNSGPTLAGWKAKFGPPKKKKIRLTEITADPALQHRVKVNEKTVEEYAEAMREGAQFPAMRAVQDSDGNIWLYRGFTRLEAAKKAGFETFPIELERGTRRDAWEKSLGENHDHGMRRTYQDLRQAIHDAFWDKDYGAEIRFAILDNDKQLWSFRKIAKLCKTNHHTVKKYWLQFHLPKVESQITDALRTHESDLFSNEAHWLQKIAQEQHVPRHIIAEQWALFAAEAEAATVQPPDDQTTAVMEEAPDVPLNQTTTIMEEAAPQELAPGVPPHQTTPVTTAQDASPDATEKNKITQKPAHRAISSWPTEQIEPVSKNELIEITNKTSGLAYRLNRPVSIQVIFEGSDEPVVIKPHEAILLLP